MAKLPPGLSPQERRVLCALGVLGAMRRACLERLLGLPALRRLVRAGAMHPGPVCSLTPLGRAWASQLRGSAPQPPAQGPHALAVADAYAALEQAHRQGLIPAFFWLPPREAGRLLALGRRDAPVVLPDAGLDAFGRAPCFLEVDRATESARRLAAKFAAYALALPDVPGSLLLLTPPSRQALATKLLAPHRFPWRVVSSPAELADAWSMMPT